MIRPCPNSSSAELLVHHDNAAFGVEKEDTYRHSAKALLNSVRFSASKELPQAKLPESISLALALAECLL